MAGSWWVVAVVLSATHNLPTHLPSLKPVEESDEDESEGEDEEGNLSDSDESEAQCSDSD